MNFPADTFRAAGLGPTDVSRLFKVSRVTAHKWLKSGNVHPWIEPAVRTRAAAVAKAVESQFLPLTDALRGAARSARIQEILDAARG